MRTTSVPPWTVMDEDSESDSTDNIDSSSWAEHRERRDNARTTARSRYRDHLTAAFTQHGATDSTRLADIALEALTVWSSVRTGAPCPCSCHPQLPESDLHDYGFDCPCTWSEDERRQATKQWRNTIEAFRSSHAGLQIAAAEQAADAELDSWLEVQQGVTIREHGGFAPESWTGNIDGHSFAFRERFGQWDIEIDHRPSGQLMQRVVGTKPDGTAVYHARELSVGERIASGTIGDPGYGTTHVERAQFIIETVRVHLTRQACQYHVASLASLDGMLGTPARWCPACGIRLAGR